MRTRYYVNLVAGFLPTKQKMESIVSLRIGNVCLVVSIGNLHADNMPLTSSFKVKYKWEEVCLFQNTKIEVFVVKALVIKLCWICTSPELPSFPIPIFFSGKKDRGILLFG